MFVGVNKNAEIYAVDVRISAVDLDAALKISGFQAGVGVFDGDE